MQCNHCGKIVPNTVKTCTFCNQVIDPNGHYIDPEEDLGNADQIYNDKKFDLKVVNEYIKEPSKRKYIFIGGAVVVVIVVVVIALIFSIISGNKVSPNTVFATVNDNVYDYLIENIFSRKGHSGRASVEFNLNEGEYHVYANGDYNFDALNDYYTYDGEFDGNYSTDDIKVSSDKLSFLIELDENDITLSSEDLFENVLTSDISVIGKMANFKGYDLKKLVSGIHDALGSTINSLYMTTTKETIFFRNADIKLNKASLALSGADLGSSYSLLIDNLSSSSKFVTELANIRGEDKNTTKAYLNDLKTTFSYLHNSSSSDYLNIDIYYDDSQLYKIDINYNDGKEKRITIESTNDIYYFDYYEAGKNKYSGSLSHTISLLNKVRHGEIKITFDKDGFITDTVIKYDDDLKSDITKAKFEGEAIEFSNLSDEEFNTLNDKLGGFIKYNNWLTKYRNKFITDCNKDLICNCTETICECEKDDKLITCPIDKVK